MPISDQAPSPTRHSGLSHRLKTGPCTFERGVVGQHPFICGQTGGVVRFGGAEDPVSRDDCRRRALGYFIAAEEAGDPEKRDALLEGGRKWIRLACQIKRNRNASA